MRRVSPAVFLVGESKLDKEEIKKFLESSYGEDGKRWLERNVTKPTSSTTDSELLTEVMGRLCYRSFSVEGNKNLTKIREGNFPYIGNIIDQKHGSVIEHGSSSWILKDVSRVLTHELVRHRAGVAVSQESLRYVRMDDFGIWLPEDPVLDPEIVAMCEEKIRSDERFCKALSDRLGLDLSNDFHYKKKWTSFIRRFAPQGMATSIGITINFRALRHVVEMRTSSAAEVEIREVFDRVAQIAVDRWPALMQDFKRKPDGSWTPENSKI